MAYDRLTPPSGGSAIEYERRSGLRWPDRPVIPFIEGDGIGPDIWAAARRVFDAAVESRLWRTAGGGMVRDLCGREGGLEVRAGSYLPDDTLTAIRDWRVAIKGPLTTPVGGGIRSLNVTLRQELDLYCCIRPVAGTRGPPRRSRNRARSTSSSSARTRRTSTPGSNGRWDARAEQVRRFLNEEMGTDIPADSGIGVKPMSERNTKRLVGASIQYALDKRRRSVTLVHKGNIMKYTEGAFREWGYEVAAEEFGEDTVKEADLWKGDVRSDPGERIVIQDRIADAMFQQLLLRPDEYDVIALPNLNGDYLSDAAAAQVGGLGMAPGGNVGDTAAVFEATHGTAPKYAGQDKVNPGSLIFPALRCSSTSAGTK